MVDRAAGEAIGLAHRALERFPSVVRRHTFIAGGAAVSGSLIALAGVAIARRMGAGQTAEEALESVTEDEIQGITHLDFGAPAEDAAESPAGERAPSDDATDEDTQPQRATG